MKLNDTIIELSLTEAHYMAGIYSSDSELEQDMKLSDWIGNRKHRCITFSKESYSTELEQAVQDGIEILIIKEN